MGAERTGVHPVADNGFSSVPGGFARGDRVAVHIEVPRASFIKRDGEGRIDFLSPYPSPTNYGSVIGSQAADGEGVDALVLGPRLPWNAIVHGEVLAAVDFIDRGMPDAKLVVGTGVSPYLSQMERARLARFFRRYARIKRLLRWTDKTQFRGWLL